MKKRVLSLFMAFVFCISLLPAAAFAEGTDGTSYVAEMNGTKYEALQEALDEMSEDKITLLSNVKENINTSVPTTIDMAGFSITGDIEAEESLTLTNGTIVGNVVVDATGGNFNMTAPSDAEAAIDGKLEIKSGSCSISGAKVGVKGTLYVDGDDFTVTGTDQAVLLNAEAGPNGKVLYGSADVNGDTSAEAVFDINTYKVGGEIAKKLSNKQVGGSTPEPVQPKITLTPDKASIYTGQSAEFTVSYNGTDDLTAYVQKSGTDSTITANITRTETKNEWKVIVTTTSETAEGKYTLFIHSTNNSLINSSAEVTVKNAVAMDSDGKYYGDIETAVKGVSDGGKITVIAKEPRLSLPDGIYVETESVGITLDLNGHSLDGYSLNVGGLTAMSKLRTGKLTVVDSSGGNGAIGLTVRDGGTLIFEPNNVNTTLLQLQVYGGKIELRGGKIQRTGLELKGDWTLGSLLPDGEGYSYRQADGNQRITLADAKNKDYVIPTYNLAVVKCTEHADSDSDSKCDYCGQQLVARVESNGVSRVYTDLQKAIDNTKDDVLYTITLLDNASGSYTITKGRGIKFVLNNKNVNEITFAGNAKVAFNGNGTVNSITFRGNSARFDGGNPFVIINKLTIADGASWSGILPDANDYTDFGNRYGYKVRDSNDQAKYIWYDRNTVKNDDTMNNVIVQQLPVTKDPELMMDDKALADESTVVVNKPLTFGFTSAVTGGYDGKGVLFIQKEGDSAPTYKLVATGDSDEYKCDAVKFDISKIGTYEVWAEVTKDGYTRTSKKYKLNVGEKLVPTGNPTLDKSEITYGDTIGSITLSGKMYDDVNKVDVEGTFTWKDPNTKPKAGNYDAEWTFTPSDADTYVSIDGQATIKVNKADIPDTAITAPEPISELVYKIGGNTPQTLHIGGSIANGYGTMKYITGNPNAAESEWSETPISATDAGDYVVYYKVFGDKNHNDSAYGTIKCHIEKYEIYYKVICKTKLYDGKTDAEFESITFYPYPTGDEQISLSADDYEVKNLKYKSSDPCGPFGTDRVYATGDIALKDTPAVRSYKLEKDGLIYGYIKPNYFPDMGNFHNYEMEIRYNDMTPKTFGASAFGAKNDKEYEVYSDGMKHDGTDEKLLHGEIDREINSDGTCSFKIYKTLDESYIGKKFVEKMIINSKDGKYCSDPYGKQTLSVIITIVDKATPKLSVNPITTEYDGKAVPSNKITGTATYDGNVVAGTWSWENSEHAPQNVSDSGEYTVVFTPDDQETYVEKVTKKVNVTIRPKPIDDVSLTLDKDSFTYNGGEQKPTITVKMNDADLVENTDYTVTNLTDMTNVGTKEIKIKGMGNFNGEKTVSYRIDKATVKVKPKNITKIYGGEPVFALESESTFITADELAEVEKTVKFTSDGTAKTAPVTEGGYEISAQLTSKETDNLILEVEGKGVLTVTPAPLTITVNDVSREYGAANPELSVSYNGFVNGENESVLGGELKLSYDSSITAQTKVDSYKGVTKAEGLTSGNYKITYVSGNMEITKIPVNASAGAATSSRLTINLDKAVEGLKDTNFVVKNGEK